MQDVVAHHSQTNVDVQRPPFAIHRHKDSRIAQSQGLAGYSVVLVPHHQTDFVRIIVSVVRERLVSDLQSAEGIPLPFQPGHDLFRVFGVAPLHPLLFTSMRKMEPTLTGYSTLCSRKTIRFVGG